MLLHDPGEKPGKRAGPRPSRRGRSAIQHDPLLLQVWIGAVGRSSAKGKVYIVDSERHQVLKELQAHSDRVTALCSAEDRYVLSGAGKHDGKIAIWKVE